MADIPEGQKLTYQLQYRKCGKAYCKTCHLGKGHGPYYYAFWRQDGTTRSHYFGKVHPDLAHLTEQIEGKEERVV